MDIREVFARNLRKARNARCLSQEALAHEADVDRTYVSALERGVSRRHATIQWAAGGFVIIDQHSNNGTWLDGVRLVPGYAYQLPPRAAVRFGDLVVQLVVG